MIDWNPVILALIALISTITVTLIPVFVTAFFAAHTAKLTDAKALIENHALIAEKTVLLIQQTYGALANSVKFQLAMKSIEKALPTLTFVALRDLLNTAVGTMHLVGSDEWEKLALPPETPPTEPTPPTIPAPDLTG